MTAGKGVDAVFQSTLSQGERRQSAMQRRKVWEFQSTLSQGERLDIHPDRASNRTISIHALARRATAISPCLLSKP